MTAQLELPGIAEGELVGWLRTQSWSDFAKSLVDFADRRGHLTESQMASALRFKQSTEARNAARKPVAAVKVAPLPGETPVPVGTFTVPHEDGGYRTLRTAVQDADAKFAPGEVILSFLSGSDNESDFTGFAFVKGTPSAPRLVVWKRYTDNVSLLADAERVLAGDPEVLVAKHCIACNRKLTRPSSIHANIGPECAKKFGGE